MKQKQYTIVVRGLKGQIFTTYLADYQGFFYLADECKLLDNTNPFDAITSILKQSVNSFKNSVDGSLLLPNLLRSISKLNRTHIKKVKISVSLFEVKITELDISTKFIKGYVIDLQEGKGPHERHLTNFTYKTINSK